MWSGPFLISAAKSYPQLIPNVIQLILNVYQHLIHIPPLTYHNHA